MQFAHADRVGAVRYGALPHGAGGLRLKSDRSLFTEPTHCVSEVRST